MMIGKKSSCLFERSRLGPHLHDFNRTEAMCLPGCLSRALGHLLFVYRLIICLSTVKPQLSVAYNVNTIKMQHQIN